MIKKTDDDGDFLKISKFTGLVPFSKQKLGIVASKVTHFGCPT
jgi:hypothetical protein